MNARTETTVQHIGVQNGFDGEKFDLYNVVAPGWRANGTTIMLRQGAPPEVVLEAAVQKVVMVEQQSAQICAKMMDRLRKVG